jgi:hypothetical protein
MHLLTGSGEVPVVVLNSARKSVAIGNIVTSILVPSTNIGSLGTLVRKGYESAVSLTSTRS